jgi:hypothetical protein
MKKSVLTLAIALCAVLGIKQPASASNHSHDNVTTLTEIRPINKIEVHGNVELYLSDGTTDEVKVFNNYYSESALVQNQNGVLAISSYKTQKLVVWITVSDLHSLAVYDHSLVKSFGKLSAIDLDVKLYNDATALLNMDAYTLILKVSDHAKADLEGTITEADLSYDHSSYLNITNLNCEHLIKKENSGNKGRNLVIL